MTTQRLTMTLSLVAAFSTACLPRGAPPAGKQIIADRTASLGAMVPPNGDGLLRILFMRPNADPGGADLYVVSVDAAGEPSPERLLLPDIEADLDLGCTWKIAPCSFDTKGRVMVYRNNPPPPAQPGMFPGPVWVDPVTGEVTEIPSYASPSGDRSITLDQTTTPPTVTVTEADGHTTTLQLAPSDQGLGGPPNYQFIGEDFYYVDPNDNLIDLPPSNVQRQVASGVVGFQVTPTPDGPLLILIRPTADPMVAQASVRDPVTGAETVLPSYGQSYGSWSFDDRYLLYSQGGFDPAAMTSASTFTLFDRSTGTTQTPDFGRTDYSQIQWRPNHDQLWAAPYYDSPAPAVGILTPGTPVIMVKGVRFQGFSQSGAYWFSTTDDPNKNNPTLDVGLADDPTGPLYPYNPPGTYVDQQWELPDGRLLESTYVNDDQRADAIVVDPRTGASQVLAERGRVAALGQTRFMGMYHFVGGRGDLTFVELDNARSTVLAPEFTVTAFAEPQGTDLLAPGARVIYQFQARTDSPYDGIWLVNSP